MIPNALTLAVQLQRELSCLSDPAELVAVFVGSLTDALPIGRIMYVLPWPPPTRRHAWMPGPGVPSGSLGYRVLLDIDTAQEIGTRIERCRAMFNPRSGPDADARGGLLGQIVAGQEPLLRRTLKLPVNEPMLGPIAAEHRSVMAVPIFWRGNIQAWIVAFSDLPDAFGSDEVRLLLSSGNMLARSAVYLDTLAETHRANARVQATLDEIGRIQRSLLPAATPSDSRVIIATIYQPSEASGGDYYDIAERPDDLLEVVIADVSGHGPVAAVCAAMLRTAIQAFRSLDRPRASPVRAVNDLMRRTLEDGMFVTALFMTLDRSNGQVCFYNCGHCQPLLRSGDGSVRTIDTAGGPPLGVVDDFEPDAVTIHLEPGDTLVLYTDGVPETFSPADELFGLARLGSAVASGGVPHRIVEELQAALAAHAAGRPPADDQTMVALCYQGPTTAGIDP